jgi:hypothetical protein
MSALSVPILLDLWERGLVQQPFEWAMALLSSAYPGLGEQELFNLSIGQRNTYLLTLREWAFGTKLACQVSCPGCRKLLEMTLNTNDIKVSTNTEHNSVLLLERDEYELRFRLPNSRDLALITGVNDITVARHQILAACLLEAWYKKQPCSIEALPTELVQAMIEQMDQADPQADMQFDLFCPVCQHQWEASFDIVSFFWREIDRWARQTLRDIHTLAAAYGWHEAEILRLSPLRRQLYLNMVNQ